MLKVKYRDKFDGVGIEFPYEELIKNIYFDGNYTIFIIQYEKVILLDIPHGEIYHYCTDNEWDEILKYIDEIIGLPQKGESFLSKIISLLREVVGR